MSACISNNEESPTEKVLLKQGGSKGLKAPVFCDWLDGPRFKEQTKMCCISLDMQLYWLYLGLASHCQDPA